MPEFCFFSSRSFTGGPLAIHQGVARANTLGANAAVMYVKLGNHARVKADGDRIVTTLNALQRRKVDKRLKALSVPECRDVPRDTVFIVPEATPDVAARLLDMGCKNVCLWWLSVDNFPQSDLHTLENQSLFHRCTHLCQSEYARQFVLGFGGKDVMMFSDITSLDGVTDWPAPVQRTYDIAYLPAKAKGAGSALTALRKEFSVVALEKMSRDQIRDTLLQSRVFLDFGHHPGKDRVPREAAMCGALPVVRKQGAAAFKEDVPLPDALLLPTELFFDEPALVARLKQILQDIDTHQAVLPSYNDIIAREADVFDQEVRDLIARFSK